MRGEGRTPLISTEKTFYVDREYHPAFLFETKLKNIVGRFESRSEKEKKTWLARHIWHYLSVMLNVKSAEKLVGIMYHDLSAD
jgi:hypothetical protein